MLGRLVKVHPTISATEPIGLMPWVRKLFPLILALMIEGCAATPNPTTSHTITNTATQQALYAASLTRAKVNFRFSDFYSLTSPNPISSCAGDAKVFYDPLNLSSNSPSQLPLDVLDTTTTIRPSFIKNVSVDLTDTNSTLGSNLAKSCSFGTGSNAPAPSSCATFDYGAVGGIPSLLGGTLLILGGAASNSTNLTVGCDLVSGTATPSNCVSSIYALGIDTLPGSAGGTTLAPGLTSASNDPISSWAQISSGATSATHGSSVVSNRAASAISYNSALQQAVVFGGASPLSGLGPTGAGSPTNDTLSIDLKTQQLMQITNNAAVSTAIQNSADLNPFASPDGSIAAGTIYPTPKAEGGRSQFGMVAVSGMAISQFGTGGTVGPSDAPVDTTDRIVIVGGYCSDTSLIACQGTHTFNPTYGPEYLDAYTPATPIIPDSTPSITNRVQDRGNFPKQFLDNHYERSVSNLQPNSRYNTPFPTPSPTVSPTDPDTAVSFGIAAINNNAPGSAGLGANSGVSGTGYVVVAGGFHGYRSSSGYTNTPSGSCTDILRCGNLEILTRWFSDISSQLSTQTSPNTNPPPGTWAEANERKASNFSAVANVSQGSQYGSVQGIQNTPVEWVPIPDGGAASQKTPWFGGGVMLGGLSRSSNDVVFFGGADCQNYMTDTTSCIHWPTIQNPGIYWSFGSDPTAALFGVGGATTPSYPSVVTMAGTPPKNAGMAAARGTDPSGNPIIVAWGGMTGPKTPDNSGTIYYLFNNNGTPTWGTYQVNGLSPAGLTNAAMVFSHVTGQFYLFGGYNVNSASSSSTWQLSIGTSSPSKTCGASTSANCIFSWALLDPSLSCYPNCPPARRSHRMVEANYHYFNAPIEPNCQSTSSPCSFGIFMEGGTSDGRALLGDRWMFDPTANAGGGLWQKMDDLPPRVLSSMTNLDYTVPSTGQTVHRAILFGGETGLEAAGSSSIGTFVPPTLGDSWMYDYSSQSWNRIFLRGARYSTTPTSISDLDDRAASLVSDSHTLRLTPPPTSGAIMVTRTLLRAHHSPQDSPSSLAIPEVFFFGGRGKDGRLLPISTVWKFCAGTTGEKPYPQTLIKNTAVSGPDDATCDAVDPILPISDYTGRWIEKTPTETYFPTVPKSWISTFKGAGTYDSLHDLVVFYGGWTAQAISSPPPAVTDTSSVTLDHTGTVYEYTPPSAVSDHVDAHLNGSWARVPACEDSPGIPQGRYGHTLAYDSFNKALVIVGGYNASGVALTQTLQTSSGNGSIPEVWTATRIDQNPDSSSTSGTYPCYSWKQVTQFGNLLSSSPTTGLAHTNSIYIPASGYDSGYYTTDDQACIGGGPLGSPDGSISKLSAGGAYIDIDRSQLGANENLILNLTFLPMGPTNVKPDQSYLSAAETAIFKLHLINTGQSGDVIRAEAQPRYFTYSSTPEFPEIVQNLAILSQPTGQIRQEQILIPLSADPRIDRIRIERYSGNAILIDMSLYRLGHP